MSGEAALKPFSTVFMSGEAALKPFSTAFITREAVLMPFQPNLRLKKLHESLF